MRDIIKKNSVQKTEKPAQIKKKSEKTAIKSQQGAKNVII